MNLKNKIYQKLKQIPKGKVVTYKNLAIAVNSKAYRYVGRCMVENKDTKHIPCYKVIKSNGMVGNYSGTGGVKGKIKLLKRDGIKIVNKKIYLKEYGWEI